MTRLGWKLLAVTSLMAGFLSACKGIKYETYGFRSDDVRLAGAGSISIQVEGTSERVDTAGELIDRTGSPYWLGIYISTDGQKALAMRKVQLRGLQSGTLVSLRVSPLKVLSDSTTYFGGVDSVGLAHEDYLVTVLLDVSDASGAKKDSVQLFLRKHYEQDHLSFLERLGKL